MSRSSWKGTLEPWEISGERLFREAPPPPPQPPAGKAQAKFAKQGSTTEWSQVDRLRQEMTQLV